MAYYLIIFALLTSIAADAQTASSEVKPVEKTASFDAAIFAKNNLQSLVMSSNALGFNIYQSIKQAEDNLVFSPYSLFIALGMVYVGSEGSTQSQMARVLSIPLRSESLARSFDLLTTTLSKDTKKGGYDFILNISNSLWMQRGRPILPEFSNSIVEDFHGQIKAVDFSTRAEDARIDINNWIRERTSGKINQLFERGEVSIDTQMLIVSTLYLKAKWAAAFNESFTRQTPFFPSASKTLTVPMMSVTGSFSYLHNAQFSLVELPYDSRNAGGLNLAMYVLLPRDIFGLSALESQIDSQKLSSWINKMTQTKVIVSLPRFKVVSSFSFEEILKKLGMVAPFSNSADFSKINGFQDLKLSKIIQKSYIMVDEKGSEAAAASGASFVSKSMDLEKSEIFLADHPFMFFILDKGTGGILFMGKILLPE